MTAPRHSTGRRLGAAALVVATLALAASLLWQGRRVRDDRLAQAFASLAEATAGPAHGRLVALQHAEQQFVRAAALVSVEPLALTGASVCLRLRDRWSARAVAPAAGSAPLQAAWAALDAAHPAEALAPLQSPDLLADERATARTLRAFATQWAEALAARPSR